MRKLLADLYAEAYEKRGQKSPKNVGKIKN